LYQGSLKFWLNNYVFYVRQDQFWGGGFFSGNWLFLGYFGWFFSITNSVILQFLGFFLEYDRDADEGMTPRILDIGLPTTAQEQDGRSKPKKPKIN
jgi:hypothetical protein